MATMRDAWATPDVEPDNSMPARSSAAAVRPAHSTAVLPPMRPLRPLQMIDGAFALLRARPRQMMGISIAFVIPTQLAVSLIQRNALRGFHLREILGDPSSSGTSTTNSTTLNLALLVAWTLSSLSLPFVAAACSQVVVADRLGTQVSTGTALKGALRRSWALLFSWIVIHAVGIAGVFCFLVPGVVMMGWYIAVAPVIALEKLGPIAAMKRSRSLCHPRYGACIGFGLVSGAVTYALSIALSGAPQLLGILTLGRYGWVLTSVVAILTSLATVPILATATVLLYIDLRVRTEGLDLEIDFERMDVA